MTVHQDEWRGMTIEERVDSLRMTVFAQEVWIRVLIQAAEQRGAVFTFGDEPAEEADETLAGTS